MTKSEIIEINGRRYDTRSGAVVHRSKSGLGSTNSNPKEKIPIAVNDSGLPPTISENDSAGQIEPSWHKKGSKHRKADNRAAHHGQKAKTLLRSAVKKPSFKNNSARVNRVSPELGSSHSKSDNSEQILVTRDADRSLRADRVAKSDFVHKFANSEVNPPDTGVQQIEVRSVPSGSHYKTQPDQVPPISKEVSNPFDTAVERAHSHEELPPRRQGTDYYRLTMHTFIAIILVVAVGSAVLYIESARGDINLAAYQSSATAIIPRSIPAGYTLKSPINYQVGRVVLTFTNDTNQMQLTEQNTTWDSKDLLNKYVLLNTDTYNVLSTNGIYVYSLNNGIATWVKNSVWFQLYSATPLSDSAIQNIATSS